MMKTIALALALFVTCSANAKGATQYVYESNSPARYSLDTSFAQFYEPRYRMNQGNVEVCLSTNGLQPWREDYACLKWADIKILRQGVKRSAYYTLSQSGGSTVLTVFFELRFKE